MRRLALGVVVLALVASCAEPTVRTTGDVRTVGVVTMTLRVDPAQPRIGQAVELTIRLVNNSGREETLRFPAGQRYDFWVERGGAEVWRWSDDQMFTQALETETLGGQTGTAYTEIWRAPEAGTYTVHGEVQAEGYDGALSAEVEVA